MRCNIGKKQWLKQRSSGDRNQITRLAERAQQLLPLQVQRLICENTKQTQPKLVPEVTLQLLPLDQQAGIVELWSLIEEKLNQQIGPPYWAVAWPGGQALARYILDNKEVVEGLCVLDLASGCAVQGIASVMAGAKSVLVVDLDPIASAAAQLNSQLNNTTGKLTCITKDVAQMNASGFDVILAGDVCFEKQLASITLDILKGHKEVALLGDPSNGRNFSSLPDSIVKLKEYIVDTCADPLLEGSALKKVSVYQFQ
eukprot:TRINITY_DN2581_c0_g2_i1.p2 TRINITY_DN2581_c0_g2~~TRINITY_DN2581_c0_g2_i1.p2  ORF type:complete len:256 (+),score=39.85 TRINITY_DN2581_c0_g2_i1:163-930(+)